MLSVLYNAVFIPVAALIGEILKSLSPWGFIVFVVLALIIRGPSWIRESLSSARWKVPGFEYDGTASSAFKKELGEAERIVERANKEIGEAYKSANKYASQLRDRHQIGTLVGNLSRSVAEIIGPSCPSDFRFTLYLPDFIFSDRLYQFTEYYDREGLQSSESVAGRTFSVRYGIIGRVWRSGVAEIEGEVISSEDQALIRSDRKHGPIEKFIARRWGLTLEEALHIKKYNSYGAVRLDFAENKLGVVFFYSKESNAFGDQLVRERKLRAIQGVLEEAPLVQKLLEISHEVAPWSGRIQIFRNS
jgi:hypothetical protein